MQCLDGAISIVPSPSLDVTIEELILVSLCDSPKMPASPHGHVNDACSPDINRSRIEFLVCLFLRGDVRSRATEPSGHVSFLFPSHPKTLAIAEVSDLERAMSGQE